MGIVLHLLACVFGTGAWVAINGLWVELPLLVNDLPEGWYLPSYLTILIQMANIGPLFVTLMHKFKPGVLSEVYVIYSIIILGIVASFLLAFFWRYTTWIAGELHSTAFLVLTFFLSLVDCTSSVTFLPFMAQLQPQYLTTYFIGEGLSGLVPGLLSLIQGVGMMKCVNTTQSENGTQGSPNASSGQNQLETQYLPANFSVQVFLFLLSIMMVFCLVAFIFLTRLSKKDTLDNSLLQSSITLSSYSANDNLNLPCDQDSLEPKKQSDNFHLDTAGDPEVGRTKYSYGQYALIYLLTGWVNALTNGVLPSIQTYSCMPYGNLAYHLAAALGSMANPLACLISMFLPSRSLVCLVLLSLLGTGFGGYNMMTAVMSPCPVLQDTRWGEALIVISWVLFIGTLSYVKVMIGVILRSQSHSALVWCGAVVQLGSMIGALLMFPLVNVYGFFKSADLCNMNCPH
ncbi:solute carrier family 52, riboflavin transporter, member 3 [Spea bombifrons]|uniref:solute carrier family 52, riboflavin transporter, member 3 n=1 Tax=Spea bombifrons TaxID=233779 RepID=UPI00234B7045|nr:solute carrier family 52, riboflavin transporter, member 3 [Spea bombifrons]XP_053310157.1 solute carrier family 52, riboflavin transporter, member 3 [Spea bombifrons]